MSLVIYNTLTNKKEAFKSIEEGKVKLYLCGPTVYDFLHIGNFRGPIFFNLVRNWLEKSGYEVNFVYNYTDIDDKIIKRANEEGVSSKEISEKYADEFEKDFNRLKLKKHTSNPRVSEHMDDIISLVESLVDQKKAYVIDGEVFYEIDQFEEYGKLSGKNLDDLQAGQRVDVDTRKKNPFDFVLWKPSKENEPSWDSPWGKGRPGWHIECSAMIRSLLGETIDIHGGGIDLIFPHHENEIAQGQGECCKPYCNYWMHNNFINLKDQKMSKSLGNILTARSFMDTYHPEILKYIMLSTHYRTMFNVNEDRIEQSMLGLGRVYRTLSNINAILEKDGDDKNINTGFEKLLKELDVKITKALDDDFNSSELFAALFEGIKSFNSLNYDKKKSIEAKGTAKLFKEWISSYGTMLSLFEEDPKSFLNDINDLLIKERKLDKTHIDQLVKDRSTARSNKDWGKSDEIRDELQTLGIEVQDSTEGGSSWHVKI